MMWIARQMIRIPNVWGYHTDKSGSFRTVIYIWLFGRKWDLFSFANPDCQLLGD